MAKGLGYRMKAYMSRHMIACDEASFLISLREDRKLGFGQWWQLKMHLLSCHLCRKYAQQIVEMSSSMEKYREGCGHEHFSHHLSPEAGERIDRELDRSLNAK